MATPIAEILGRGVAFPFRVGSAGRLGYSAGDENVRESLRVILLTEPGERLMRPEFGCGLRRLLFEPNNAATQRLIQEEITRAIARWEPRVRLEAVTVEPTEEAQRMVATIRYQLLSSGAREQVALNIDLEA